MCENPHSFVSLCGETPFSKGRFRQVYAHPADNRKCVKIDHFEKPEKGASFNAFFRTALTGNQREAAEYRRLMALDADYRQYFPQFYGTIETDLGKGICVELLKGTDGKLPMAIRDYLYSAMPIPREFCLFFREEYRKFAAFCERHLIMSVSDGFENLGIIQVDGRPKLVSFDLKGVTNKQLIPLTNLSSTLKRQRIRRRFERKMESLTSLIAV